MRAARCQAHALNGTASLFRLEGEDKRNPFGQRVDEFSREGTLLGIDIPGQAQPVDEEGVAGLAKKAVISKSVVSRLIYPRIMILNPSSSKGWTSFFISAAEYFVRHSAGVGRSMV